MFKTGTMIKVTHKAHVYSHMGFSDPNTIIPETVEIMRVARVIRSKKHGLIVWFKRPDGTGYGINDVENNPQFDFLKA